MALFSKTEEEERSQVTSGSKARVQSAPASTFTKSTSAEERTVIGQSVTAEGVITSDGAVHVHGTLKGTITTTNEALVGASAQVEGDVHAETVTIAGRVEGDVVAKNTLSVTSTGVVSGTLTAKTLKVEEGATISGRVEMTHTDSSSSSKSTPKQNKKQTATTPSHTQNSQPVAA